MKLLSCIATSFTLLPILSHVPIVHSNPQVPTPVEKSTLAGATTDRDIWPWGEMQKGSESKQVVDRELKKVSTLAASLVVCFTLHTITINSPSHPP